MLAYPAPARSPGWPGTATVGRAMNDVPLALRILAVIFVLPFRLAWELLAAIGRFLAAYVGRPLAWLAHYAVVVPLSFLARYLLVVPLTFLLRYLVVVPLTFLLRYLVVMPLTWFFAVTAPMWRGLGRGLSWVVTQLGQGLWWAVIQLHRWVLRPCGLAAGWLLARLYRWVLRPGWRGAGWVLFQLYAWLLRPVGQALAWGWSRTVVPAYRALAAATRWVRISLLRPVAEATRAMLVSAGLASGRREPTEER